MLRCVMLWYVMICYVMICYDMLWYFIICYVMLCNVMLCCVIYMLYNIMLYFVILRYFLSCVFHDNHLLQEWLEKYQEIIVIGHFAMKTRLADLLSAYLNILKSKRLRKYTNTWMLGDPSSNNRTLSNTAQDQRNIIHIRALVPYRMQDTPPHHDTPHSLP